MPLSSWHNTSIIILSTEQGRKKNLKFSRRDSCMSSEHIFLNLFAWEFFKDARIIKAIFNLGFCSFSFKASTLNLIGWKGSGMENYGDETLWEMLAHPKSMGEGRTMWFPTIISATFSTPNFSFLLLRLEQ